MFNELTESIIRGRTDTQTSYSPDPVGLLGVMEKVEQAVAEGIEPERIIRVDINTNLDDVGRKFIDGGYYVPCRTPQVA